jgi:uncharacterized membrane protein
MIVMTRESRESIRKTAILIFLFSVLTAAFVMADDEAGHGTVRSINAILGEIREQQGIGPGERIDPDRVDPGLLEELGEAVMSLMVPDPERHEWMDRMMGGEGSESLAERHRWMGYRYLNGGRGPTGMMGGGNFDRRGGWAPMMGFPPWAGKGNWRYGGMMGWNGGNLWIWILASALVAAVVVLAILYSRGRREGGYSSTDDALEILKRRFARGEIGREEFDRIRRDLAE